MNVTSQGYLCFLVTMHLQLVKIKKTKTISFRFERFVCRVYFKLRYSFTYLLVYSRPRSCPAADGSRSASHRQANSCHGRRPESGLHAPRDVISPRREQCLRGRLVDGF